MNAPLALFDRTHTKTFALTDVHPVACESERTILSANIYDLALFRSQRICQSTATDVFIGAADRARKAPLILAYTSSNAMNGRGPRRPAHAAEPTATSMPPNNARLDYRSRSFDTPHHAVTRSFVHRIHNLQYPHIFPNRKFSSLMPLCPALTPSHARSLSPPSSSMASPFPHQFGFHIFTAHGTQLNIESEERDETE